MATKRIGYSLQPWARLCTRVQYNKVVRKGPGVGAVAEISEVRKEREDLIDCPTPTIIPRARAQRNWLDEMDTFESTGPGRVSLRQQARVT